jgi:hypothetical protein
VRHRRLGRASRTRARRLLAFVDEKTCVEEILARAACDFVDGMLLFEQLAADGVVAFA